MARICVDKGHGKPWPGAVYAGVQEATIVALVGVELVKELKLRGHTVITTREGEHSTQSNALPGDRAALTRDLIARAQMANDFKADLFISLHVNAHRDPEVKGAETWAWYTSNDGLALANQLQVSLVKECGFKDRGVKTTNAFRVLKETGMTAALVEMGFLSNGSDRAIITSTDFKRKAAVALANGIEKHLQAVRKA